MNTRIRYIKDGAGGLTSMQVLRAQDGTEYKTAINLTNTEGYVLLAKGNSVVSKCTGTSLHKVKIAVKKKLEELGVVFEKEQRTKRNTNDKTN